MPSNEGDVIEENKKGGSQRAEYTIEDCILLGDGWMLSRVNVWGPIIYLHGGFWNRCKLTTSSKDIVSPSVNEASVMQMSIC